MRMTFALPVLALGLVGCANVSRPAVDVGRGVYRAIGTEPFWDLTIGRDLVFTDRGNNNLVVAEPAPLVQRSANGERYAGRRLSVTIDRRACSDGMSERSYPDTVNVTVDGRAYRGCGANSAFFAQASENGLNRPGQGEHDLSNTNWRVVSINGQAVPMSGYYFNFAPDRVAGKLGCNAISGGYSVAGSTLRADALTMTEMACPGNRFESQGVGIMGQLMTLSESGDSLTLTNRLGTIALTRAR